MIKTAQSKILSLLSSILGLVLCIFSPAQAQTFQGGFSSASALKWTSSLPSSYLNTYVVPAANSWNSISSKVNLGQTTGAFQIRVVTDITPIDGRVGLMMPYCTISGVGKSGDICIPTTWGSAQVIGYTNQITAYQLNTSQIISRVYTHEFGHALSLAHTYDAATPSVLSDLGQVYSLSPQQLDKTNLKQRWGN
jgi:hypothetical protein